MSSGCSTRSAIAPGVSAIGNITAPEPSTRQPPLPVRSVSPIAGMSQAEQMPELVQRHRFQIDPARLAAGRHRKHEAGVEEDVGLVDRAGGGVDHEAGGGEHAIEVRPIEKADRVAAVGAFRRRRRHALV